MFAATATTKELNRAIEVGGLIADKNFSIQCVPQT